MPQLHDLYFLIYPPPHLAIVASRLLDGLRLPPCLRRGQPMCEERLHITIEKLGRFQGQVPNQILDQAIAAGSSLVAEPFDVSLELVRSTTGRDGGGMAQLIGRGLGLRGVRRFERRLAQAMREAGCDKSQIRSSFHPHVTLNYQHEAFDRCTVTPLAWRVTQFMLVDSLYGFSKHEVLGCWPLISRQQELLW